MDPNVCLAQILAKLLLICDTSNAGMTNSDADAELANEVLAQLEDLGAHLRKGGALPDEWKPR